MKNSRDTETRLDQLWIGMVDSRTDRWSTDVLQQTLSDGRRCSCLVNNLLQTQAERSWFLDGGNVSCHILSLAISNVLRSPVSLPGPLGRSLCVGRSVSLLSCTCCCCRCKIFRMRDTWQAQRMGFAERGQKTQNFCNRWSAFPSVCFPGMQVFLSSDGVRWVLTSESPDESHEDYEPASCQSENRFVSCGLERGPLNIPSWGGGGVGGVEASIFLYVLFRQLMVVVFSSLFYFMMIWIIYIKIHFTY